MTRKAQLLANDGVTEISPITDSQCVKMSNGNNLEQEFGEIDSFSPSIYMDGQSMFKAGQGLDVDYSGQVKNGAYEECVLEGKTLVNLASNNEVISDNSICFAKRKITGKVIILNAHKSSTCYFNLWSVDDNRYIKHVNIQSNTLMYDVPSGQYIYNIYDTSSTNNLSLFSDLMIIEYQDGMENWSIPYFTGMCDVKMPILRNVGKNLLPPFTSDKWNHRYVDGMKITSTSISGTPIYSGFSLTTRIHLLSNVNYRFSGSNTGNNLRIRVRDINNENIIHASISNKMFTVDKTSEYMITVENNSNITESLSLLNPQLEQSTNFTLYEPYKSNILLPYSEEIKLTEDMFEQGGSYVIEDAIGLEWNNMKGEALNNHIRVKQPISVKPSTTYKIIGNANCLFAMGSFTSDSKCLGRICSWSNSVVFTTNASTQKVSIVAKNKSETVLPPSNLSSLGIQLVEVDKTLVLRSLPNGVKDELNMLTGEYIQRVGEVVLDGSESLWESIAFDGVNKYYETTDILPHKSKGVDGLIGFSISDKLKNDNPYNGIGRTFGTYNNLVRIRLDNMDKTEIKNWLLANKLTIQYPLETPIHKTLILSSTSENIDEGVVLPNGVKNEYNPKTGVFTKNIGKVVLDGSENWYLMDTPNKKTTNGFMLLFPKAKHTTSASNCNILCDQFEFNYDLYAQDKQGVHMFSNPTAIAIKILVNKINSNDINGFKQWLKQNPTTVWYELAEPQQIQLTPHFAKPTPFAYKDGHVILESGYKGETLYPSIKYSVVTNRTGQITQHNKLLLKQEQQLSNLEALLLNGAIGLDYQQTLLQFKLDLK